MTSLLGGMHTWQLLLLSRREYTLPNCCIIQCTDVAVVVNSLVTPYVQLCHSSPGPTLDPRECRQLSFVGEDQQIVGGYLCICNICAGIYAPVVST